MPARASCSRSSIRAARHTIPFSSATSRGFESTSVAPRADSFNGNASLSAPCIDDHSSSVSRLSPLLQVTQLRPPDLVWLAIPNPTVSHGVPIPVPPCSSLSFCPIANTSHASRKADCKEAEIVSSSSIINIFGLVTTRLLSSSDSQSRSCSRATSRCHWKRFGTCLQENYSKPGRRRIE